LLWHYKTASNGWIQAGGSTLDTATMLLPYYRAGRNTIIQAADVPTLNQNTTGSAATLTTGRTIQTNLASTSAATFNGSANITPGVTGTLPVANGGTNNTSYISGAIPYSNGTSLTSDTSRIFFDNTNRRFGINTTNFTDPIAGSSKVKFVDGTMDLSFRDNATGQGYLAVGSRTNNIKGFLGHTNTDDGFVMGSFSNHQIAIRTNNVNRLFISNAGAVTINNLAGINDVGADANGKLQAATSDMNLKNTIEDSPFGLNEILLLNPVTFLYNDENRKIDSDVKEVGFIAQDVFDIIPNAVSSTGTGDLQLDYRAITATLTKAIQEQNVLIKALEQRILILENK
jgi:hypothetical protein